MGAALTEEQAHAIFALGEATVVFALLAQAKMLAEQRAAEAGWRVNGKTHWLWCFATNELSSFMIDRSRGSPALMNFSRQEFAGTLVSDFWAPYNAVACASRQKCLVHLLRDLEHVELYKSPGAHWAAFAKKLRRLIGDAIGLLRLRADLTPETYASRRACLTRRLDELIATPCSCARTATATEANEAPPPKPYS
ncbi:MAG: transposase [Candidatus Hydrogenedentes bacterium]|nr:transposase [Candidatus Hydrogenedentota bacterium]